ncbi:DUF4232 domain-containing protein [Curtobacterium sp. L1-20]|uniref:DUF4232 domain-containing protein n=1 Tax=Curtobacterium sp. L1-20 TaxID=3138181 RepID=UPI003B529348
MQQLTVRGAAAAALVVVLAATAAGCASTVRAAPTERAHVQSLRSPRCDAASLSATVSGRDGAALPPRPIDEGAVLLAVVFTNEGHRSCVLQGWPTARLVADGRPFGPAALKIRAVPSPAVTLRPDKRAQVYVALHAGQAPINCVEAVPEALAVALPHSDRPLTAGLPSDYLGSTCRTETETLIGMQAVLPL